MNVGAENSAVSNEACFSRWLYFHRHPDVRHTQSPAKANFARSQNEEPLRLGRSVAIGRRCFGVPLVKPLSESFGQR